MTKNFFIDFVFGFALLLILWGIAPLTVTANNNSTTDYVTCVTEENPAVPGSFKCSDDTNGRACGTCLWWTRYCTVVIKNNVPFKCACK
jgi:hypothetical protein